MEIIYLDSLFFLNLLTDYLLCLATGRICGLYLKRRRYLFAALVGALYAAAAVLPSMRFLSGAGCKLAVGVLMSWIAFGSESHPLRCTLVLFLISAVFGGLLYALTLTEGAPASLSLRSLLILFPLCYGLLSLLSRFRSHRAQQPRAEITLQYEGREARFFALVDSGNGLFDPSTGAGVLVVNPAVLRPLFREYTDFFTSLTAIELLRMASELPALQGRFHLIPYRSLSGSSLLPAFRPDLLLVDGKENRELVVALSGEASGDGFDAIL